MINKKGDIWVSAVLYFGLGMIVIAILLAAGLPVINKLRDKNIEIQTKTIFHTLDQNIREVLSGGPGTQRVVTLNIKKGEFSVDKDAETITWTFKNSKAYLSEPDGSPVKDGNLEIKTTKSTTKNNYDISFTLSYLDLAKINPVEGPQISTFSGQKDIVIRNGGVDPNSPQDNQKIILRISETK